MRRTTLGLQLLSALAFAAPASELWAQNTQVATAADERWSNEELDNLLAPIALYPDPILAQVLVAATYPDQVLAAQAHVRAFGSQNIDEMPWELSVKSVARYEPVLNLLAEGEDWMTALGQAYASQPVDVMNAVQRLRAMANEQGNLQSTQQQQVVVEREVIRIVPAEPQIIYVPTYDPAVVYHRPVYITHAHPAYWSWGVGYPVGVWLSYDVDWWSHRVYHHGWHSHGPRWVVVARPFIVINPWYVAPRHTVIVVNRGIAYRRWDTHRVRRYSTIHRNVGFDRHDRGFRRDVSRGYNGNRGDDDRGSDARGNNGSNSRGGSQRVTPLPGAPSRIARGGDAASATRGSADSPRSSATARSNAPRSATPRSNGETARSSNGTWNPRASRQNAEPARTSRTETAAPRSNSSSAPRVSTPRSSEQSTPRASAPRSGGQGTARASGPRGGGESAARASAPRSGGQSAPRASAPRSGGQSAPRASAPRSSGGEARGSGRSGGSSSNGSSRGGGRSRGN